MFNRAVTLPILAAISMTGCASDPFAYRDGCKQATNIELLKTEYEETSAVLSGISHLPPQVAYKKSGDMLIPVDLNQELYKQKSMELGTIESELYQQIAACDLL